LPKTNTTSADTRVNLATLASELEALPADYAQFEMDSFIDGDTYRNSEAIKQYLLTNGGVASCGTSACAVGHGPSAGLFFKADEIGIDLGDDELLPDWSKYVRRVFGVAAFSDDFNFMFGGNWHDYDNTVHGAAARIRYYLARGVPEAYRAYDSSIYQEYLIDA